VLGISLGILSPTFFDPNLSNQGDIEMPKQQRFNTDYPGVYYIVGTAIGTGKPEKIFYIFYRKDGKQIEEKAGRQYQDDMTAAKASRIRADRIEGKSVSNKARREGKLREKQIQEWTVKRLWAEYLSTKPKTRSYHIDDGRFKKHVEPLIGDKTLEDLAPLDLDRLRINLLKQKSPQTVKHCLEIIKRISNFAKNKQLCKGIEFKVVMPKVNNLKTEFLTESQLKTLLEVIQKDTNPYAGPIMLTALYAGMRKGEILKLEWKDIDFERGFIHIRDPKGGADAKIPLNEAVKTIFEGLPRTHNLIFPGMDRQETTLYQAISKIKKKADLPKDFRPLHGLRHQYASMLASSGEVDMYVLQKLLTHKSPLMTQRYAHLRDESLRKASNLAGELVNQIMTEKKKEEEEEYPAKSEAQQPVGGEV
jgi:integrase